MKVHVRWQRGRASVHPYFWGDSTRDLITARKRPQTGLQRSHAVQPSKQASRLAGRWSCRWRNPRDHLRVLGLVACRLHGDPVTRLMLAAVIFTALLMAASALDVGREIAQEPSVGPLDLTYRLR